MDSPHLDQFDSGSLFDLFQSSPSDLRLDLDALPSFLSSDDARIDAVNDNAANSMNMPGTWGRRKLARGLLHEHTSLGAPCSQVTSMANAGCSYAHGTRHES